MSRSRRQSLRDNMHNLGHLINQTPVRLNRRISQATERLGRRLSNFAHLHQGRLIAAQGEEEEEEATPALPDLPAPMAEIELSYTEQVQADAPYSGSTSSARGFGTGSQEQSSGTEPYRSSKSSSHSSSRPSPPSNPLSRERSASEHASAKNLQHNAEPNEVVLVQRAPARSEREAKAREEDSAATEQFKYGMLQQAGLLRLRWIEDPSRWDCPIAKSTLTFDAFHQMLPSGTVRARNLSLNLEAQIVGLGVPTEFYDQVEESAYREFEYIAEGGEMHWVGSTGPGVIFLEIIGSQKGFPHISDITLAFYKRDFPIDKLKYIFVGMVIQPGTLRFVRHHLYPAHSIPWPYERPQAWAFGTPEYEALLGTRIGKTIAYIVLGGFDRGTRRIEQILTWSTVVQGSVNMRFDIRPTRTTGTIARARMALSEVCRGV